MFDKAKTDSFVESLKVHFNNSEEKNDYDATVRCLEGLVNEYGTDSYYFNYVTERIVELCWMKVKGVLPEIVDDYITKIELINFDEKLARVAFAAYYTLSLIYKKDNNIEELGKLLGDAYALIFQRFPLYYEMRARYHKRIGDYKNAIRSDLEAIDILEDMKVENPAVFVSFASTVSMVCESGNIASLKNKNYIGAALTYIDRAIDYNPTYSKYYYIKGKLIYYRSRNILELDEFEKNCEEAKKFVNEAKKRLNRSDIHYTDERNRYTLFIEFIDNDLEERKINEETVEEFVELSAAEIRAKKDFILSSVEAQNCRPERPVLRPGQKYIFISYSSIDFKSVYCDLVDLYARKIPFDYDEALTHGKGWENQIKEKINNDDCVGVIFYLSSNTILSESIEKEIDMINQKFSSSQEFEEHCFWVNLERGYTPFRLMLKAIHDNEINYLLAEKITARRMITYLETFDDSSVFTEKSGQPDSDAHIDVLVRSIKEKFPELSDGQGDK